VVTKAPHLHGATCCAVALSERRKGLVRGKRPNRRKWSENGGYLITSYKFNQQMNE